MSINVKLALLAECKAEIEQLLSSGFSDLIRRAELAGGRAFLKPQAG